MLSARGTEWAKIGFAHGEQDVYHPSTNAKGVVSFSNAENWLMHSELARFINETDFDESCCRYGEGYTGTARLRLAMAGHLNTHFDPAHPVDAEQITFAAGVTDLNEVCALVTCDPEANESIMLGRPVYGAFSRDLTMRTGVALEYVSVGDTDQFSPACVPAFEAGYEAAKARGVNIKALMICNPHNPLGQCYPRETLEGLLRLCAAKGIHLISDEIYALSVFPRNDGPSENFTSVRSIDHSGLIDPGQVHVLYGLSKDFAAGGMRLGCLISQNLDFTNAARAICRFSSPSQLSMDIAARLFESQEFVTQFLAKSHDRLLRSRQLAEKLLSQEGISYHQPGNAGLFLWVDLSPHLPLQETNGDGWAAERLLSEKFSQVGVEMSTGEAYRAPNPGRFRLVHCLPEESVREGIRRILQVIKG